MIFLAEIIIIIIIIIIIQSALIKVGLSKQRIRLQYSTVQYRALKFGQGECIRPRIEARRSKRGWGEDWGG